MSIKDRVLTFMSSPVRVRLGALAVALGVVWSGIQHHGVVWGG
ncbi:MAG TPA: hypothetical protein VFT66_19000 [Roseiflexaceae bacterium]|jgi:hypothetical protein|nr:hypothetical protein [Roseiflexaceae bacterium]